ncbi:NAD(P)H-dependent FMN reductase [soil metagenome]
MTSLLAISGSLRANSFNTNLLRSTQALVPDGVTVELADLADIPMFNQDLEANGIPAAVQTLKDRIAAADGVIFATPEYTRSIPGVLKNALDWVSRGPVRPLSGKPVIAVSASGSPFGGIRALTELRQLLTHLGANVTHSPEVAVGQANTKFDELGVFTDEAGIRFYTTLLGNLLIKIELERRMKELV